MIKELIQRWQIRKLFSPYVSKETIDKIAFEGLGKKKMQKLTKSRLEFVLVALRGDNAQRLSEQLGSITNLAVRHNGVVQSIISSLIVIVYGITDIPKETSATRFTLLEALTKQFGSEIKIVHGAETGYYGNIGGANLLSYGFIIPNFLEALGQLSTISFGEVKEIGTSGLTSGSN